MASLAIFTRLGQMWKRVECPDCCDSSAPALQITVRCDRCGEIIRARVEKAYEIEALYESSNGHGWDNQEEPKPTGYILHKELVGARCQNLLHVVMEFDAQRHIISRHISGGEFVQIVDCE